MISSTPYDPENPFRAAVSNDGSAKSIPSPSRTNSGRRTMQDVSLDEDDSKRNHSERGMDDVKKDFEGMSRVCPRSLAWAWSKIGWLTRISPVDLAVTGKWGSVSRKEIIAVAATVILLLVGMVVAIVLLVGGGGSDSSDLTTLSQAPSMAPTGTAVAFASAMDEYLYIQKALSLNVLTSKIELPQNQSSLRAISQFEEDPYVSAAAWLFFKDPANLIDGSLERFAVVSLYFAWMGDEWFNYKNWLVSHLHVCDWAGVSCGVNDVGSKVVTELSLPSNKLMGTLPASLSMLTELTAFRLNDNQLTGKVDGDVIGSLQKLTALELQNNDLSGQLPSTLLGPSLESVHVEGNGFYGSWGFCGGAVTNFTLDCKFLACPCCDATTNCVNAEG